MKSPAWRGHRYVLAAAAVLALVLGAANVGAGDVTMSVTVTHTPASVAHTAVGATRVNLVAYPITLLNNGPSNATLVNLTLPDPQTCTPAGTGCGLDNPAVYASPDVIFLTIGDPSGTPSPIDPSACTRTDGTRTTTCSLGTIRPGAANAQTVTAVYRTPATGAALSFSPTVTVKSSNAQTSATHIFPTAPDVVLLGSPDGNGTYVKPGEGATVTTDPDNNPNAVNQDTYLPGNGMTTNASFGGAVNPKGIGAHIQESACGDGSCMGRAQVSVALTFTQQTPLTLFFRLDALATGGVRPTKITVTHTNDQNVTSVLTVCPKSGPIPADGCISGTVAYKDKDAGIAIKSLSNGDWRMG